MLGNLQFEFIFVKKKGSGILKEEKNSVLYKMKSIDKLIVRIFFTDLECEERAKKREYFPSRSQMEIIHYMLKHINEEVYQKDLEEALNLRRATISGVLATMEKNGFIERTVYENDTRIKKITLSQKAKKEYLRGIECLDKAESKALKGVSRDELETFNKVLDKIIENLKK